MAEKRRRDMVTSLTPKQHLRKAHLRKGLMSQMSEDTCLRKAYLRKGARVKS